MKDKKQMIGTLLLGLLSLSAGAKENSQADSIRYGKTKEPLYLQLYGGINKSANEHLPWSEFSKYPWAYGCFLAVGKEFSPVWGVRMALAYNVDKSRNVQECDNPDTWKWQNVELFADATFDITDALRSHEEKCGRFNLKGFLGIGGLYTFGFPQGKALSYDAPYSRDSKMLFGFRGGLTATYRLNKNLALGAELSQTMAMDAFNGVVDHKAPLDGRTNLSVGVTYYLNKRGKRQQAALAPIQYDHRLKVIPALPIQLPSREAVKVRRIVGRAFLDFPINETAIYPEYRLNPGELRRIKASVDSARFDESVRITRISLHGYASPESPYANNTRLAKGRTEALMSYLQKQYGFATSIFKINYTPEDWDNLRNFIANDDRRLIKADAWYSDAHIKETPKMPAVVYSYKQQLLDVIDRQMDLDAKEELLKRVGDGKPYQWLLQHVYPGLRHTDYVIDYIVKPYPIAEARELVYMHPEALSAEELYRVAISYDEGSDEYYDALMIAANQNPTDTIANLNAACACIKRHRLIDARQYALKAGDGENAKYVRGIIDAMEGKAIWRMDGDRVILQ